MLNDSASGTGSWEILSAWALLPLPVGSSLLSTVPGDKATGVLLPPPQAYPLSCCPAFSLPARKILLTGRHHPQRPQPQRKPPRAPSQRGLLPQDMASHSSSGRYQLGAPRLPGPGPSLVALGSPWDASRGWAVWAAALRCRRGGPWVTQLEGLTHSQRDCWRISCPRAGAMGGAFHLFLIIV